METMEKDEVIAIASDHAGFLLKRILCKDLEILGYQILDMGTDSLDSVDYPLFAHNVAAAVASGKAGYGVIYAVLELGSVLPQIDTRGFVLHYATM